MYGMTYVHVVYIHNYIYTDAAPKCKNNLVYLCISGMDVSGKFHSVLFKPRYKIPVIRNYWNKSASTILKYKKKFDFCVV